MTFEIGLTIVVIGLAVGLLIMTRWAAEWIMLGALLLLILSGVIAPDQAVSGFANQGMIAVGLLYILAAGIRETGALDTLTQRLLGHAKGLFMAQLRLLTPVAIASALMNNTPLVATLMPSINDWARRRNIPASRLLMPLSFAAILGGMCTLIGTSTNLLVYGMMDEQLRREFGVFDLAMVGIPAVLVGLVYILVAGKWLLPHRRSAHDDFEDPRSYTVEMLVETESPLIGKSIEKAGLRHLPGMYLMEIQREGHVLAAVSSDEILRGGDRLVFVGVVDSVVDLRRMKGLRVAEDQVFKLDTAHHERTLIEAVVSEQYPLLGKTVREGQFRRRYRAAIIAVSRHGQRLEGKIGDMTLRAGDVLLLEGHPHFADQQRHARDFHLVSQVANSQPPRRERSWLALGALSLVILLPVLTGMSIMVSALLGAILVLMGKCLSVDQARKAIDWQVLLVIAAAFGLSEAMVQSGTADWIGHHVFEWSGHSAYVGLILLFIVTTVLSNLITNNAAAVLMVPIALNYANQMQVEVIPFLVTVMIAASCGLATPISYQTNLMVYGPGGYRFLDYLRFGGPLTLLIGGMTIALVPVIWPF